MTEIPRLKMVAVEPGAILSLTWQDGRTDRVLLAGWIALGEQLLAALKRPEVFATAHVGSYGTAVEWGDDDELAIDSHHLELLVAEQRPFDAEELKAWQAETGLSNQEAADMFDIAVSTWSEYRAGGTIPGAVRIAARAARRDPVIIEAHYRPRTVGRPRQDAALPVAPPAPRQAAVAASMLRGLSESGGGALHSKHAATPLRRESAPSKKKKK